MIQIKIDGVDYSQYAVQPFKWENLLDERLDHAMITLKAVPVYRFYPLSMVEITATLGSTSETRYYVIGDDSPSENPSGSGLYDHQLPLLEVTKKSERDTTNTLVYLNNLGRTYTGNPLPVEPVYE